MKIRARFSIIIPVIFVWVGFVCAISFMESWLKFNAPGITLSLGIGIGKLVFNALNKAELMFALITIACLAKTKHREINVLGRIFLVPFSILLLQSFYLLPELGARSNLQIEGKQLAPSYLHLFYIITEIIKVICLILLGMFTLKYYKYDTGRINYWN